MKNIVKIIIATVGIALMFAACQKEGDLPLYKAGKGSVELTSSATTVAAVMVDADKPVLTLNWSWPNYATDSVNQKFIVQIAPAGTNFEKPVTRTLKGVQSTSFTAKELNTIVFGFGTVSGPSPLDVRLISSYANNNEQYQSNTVNVVVTPYIVPVTLALNPTGPLTLTFENAASNAVTFNWNATAFGNLPLNYAIQIDKAGGDFKTPVVKAFGTALTGGITGTDLNRAAISAGIAPNTTGDLAIRVIAGQGDKFANPVYSNVATLKVTTYLDVVKFWVVGAYNGWDNSDKALTLLNTPSTGANAEGYVNFDAAGDFKLVTNHSWDDAHTFGDDGTNTGKLSNVGGGKNIPVPAAGYYLIKANPLTMTYTLTPTIWGIIGDATKGLWNDQTNMTYNPTSMTFNLAAHMTAGAFKFRGTSDWGVNYGSTAGNATLDAGGSNIPVTVESDYAITLDLSHPTAYTYSANRWGLIGSATPDAWNSDQNMTWDAANKVFTITLDLIVGEYKFRANDAWDINLGGDLTALTQNGGNLAVTAAGNYTITLDPWTLKATIKKN
ncbi:MAG TPA: hypothetical protein DCL77_02645 [Prolixibacteraceae bacterium]|jgi:hypothetical protein|nr:hypothetical protein [Prolixibacteraceae bacterium]